MKKQTLKMSVDIKSPKEKVWDVLMQDETYREWTSAFHPGSYAESDWREGGKALFKTPEGDGMVSKITVHRPAEVISFEHQGILKGGKEDFEDEEAQKWMGFTETYRVKETNGKSRLSIEQDITEEYMDQFKKMWKEALDKVKEISESRN